MTKHKLNANNLVRRKRLTPEEVMANRDLIEGKPARGRPKSLVPKKGVMMYVPEELHQDFRLCAQMIEKRPMNDVLEEFMRGFVAERAGPLGALKKALVR